MKFSIVPRTLVVALALAALVACDSAEERAAKHYQNALDFLATGDTQLAMVEFRNVFALDGGNLEARMKYADTARSIGDIPESYASYLRVVEQTPDNHEARLALVQMAIDAQDWDEAERHGAALIDANADIDGADSIKLALAFRKAVLAKNDATIRDLTRDAATLFESRRDDSILQRILIEGYANQEDYAAALEIADIAIAQRPDMQLLYLVKSQLLERLGDADAVEAHLRETIARFPEDEDSKLALIRQLASRGRIDDAEAFLREELATSEQPADAHVALITFLRQTRGNEAALAELDRAIETYEGNRLFRALRAGVLFDIGDTDGAVAAMQAVVEGSEPGQETDTYRVTLARMLVAVGEETAARGLVDEVLASDPGQVTALKMSARWNIDDDQPEEALRKLRLALDTEPEDAETMTLMSEAHQRAGNPELAQDLLALAVEASGNAPEESLRFARLLADNKRYRPAEDVVVRALRTAPGHPELLMLLGRIYLATEDWDLAAQAESTLRRQGTEQTKIMADDLRLQIVARQQGREAAVSFIETLNAEDNATAAARIALIQSRITEGRNDDAVRLAEELAQDYPQNAEAKLLVGNTYFSVGRLEEAEQATREVVDAGTNPSASLQLVRILGAQGRMEDAGTTLDQALVLAPDDESLLWAKASLLEQAKDFEGAIAIYENLYAADSSSLIVANNLASLLATYRDDDESHERAFTVARRLKGTDVAPFQDTYGWILYRRGDFAEALTYLEPAARELRNDPIVQYHAGKIYEALGQGEEAATAFGRAVELVSEDDTRSQIFEAREYLKALPVTQTDR